MSDVTIETLLGGRALIGHPVKTEMDLYELSRVGIPKKSLLHLLAALNLSLRAVSELLNVTERTIQRKQDQELLDRATTEQVLQIAEVFSRGNAVFGSTKAFQLWMDLENTALGGKRPLELLASRYGAQLVLDVIGRIEHGVIS